MLQATLDAIVSNPLSTLTGVLVLVTLYYAIITHIHLSVSKKSVEVMRKQNEMSTRPYIIVRPIRDGMVFHLQITNTGKTAAENLKLDIDSSFYCADEEDKNLKEQHLFSEGVESFAPGAEVNYMLGTMPQIFGDEQPKRPMPTTLRAGSGRICVKKQWTVGSDSQPNEQIPTAHAPTTASRACGIHYLPENG